MPAIAIPYTTFQLPPSAAFPERRSAKRPLLQVTLRSPQRFLSCYAIVDTGADYCVFPRSFLQPLGLNALQGPTEMTQGIGGSVPTHFFGISIDIGGHFQFPVFAGFTAGLDALGLGLLGQVGFFDRFNVTFKHSEGIYLIEGNSATR